MKFSWLKVVLLLCFTLYLTGCMQTTQLKSQTRQQFILIPQQLWHSQANREYQHTLDRLKQRGVMVYDQRLSHVLNQLKPHTYQYRPEASHWDWQINALISSQLNAHGFAGGKLLLHTGIYWGLNLTEDELAFVIAHEMAHAVREHSREHWTTELLLGPLARLKNNGHSTSWIIEREADLLGLEILEQAGYDPYVAITFWQKYQYESLRRLEHGGSQPLISQEFLDYRMQAIQNHLTAFNI